jgi:DNA polymerase I-like protein with 3'-5' exonuclease and polymerase domains
MPVRTWGGRYIYSEPAKFFKGQHWSFEYKLINYLIQGSAADQTKEAIVTAGYKTPYRRFLMTVHDENVYSVKPNLLALAVDEIKSSMEDQPGWDVPFKAEVECGRNWHDLTLYEDFNDY